MPTIETVYARLRTLVAEFDPEGKGEPRYKASADPFTFELSPRAELTSFYLDAPQTQEGAAFTGGASEEVTRVTVWLSREARDDAGEVAASLGGDLAKLKRALLTADLGADVNVRPGMSLLVQGRREGDTTVVGACRFAVDYVEAGAR